MIHIRDVAPEPEAKRWLVRPLWACGVGVVGGIPKSFKTWFATEIVFAVATGNKALGQFEVEQPGPVLVFQAEGGGPALMRSRLAAIASVRGGRLDEAPIHLISCPVLHLDDAKQLDALRGTVSDLKPRLLLLDPYVRLVRHSDENSAAEVSAVLGALSEIQRSLDVTVMLVHHMRKAATRQVSQQLRGSSDFSAWSDSAVYITPHRDEDEDRILRVEHRAAPAPPPVVVRLVNTPAPHLEVIDGRKVQHDAVQSLSAAILERLSLMGQPQSTVALRNVLRVRKATLVTALESLRADGLVIRTDKGWNLPETDRKE